MEKLGNLLLWPQLITDRLGIIYEANEPARELLGREIIGKQVFSFVERDAVASVRGLLSSLNETPGADLHVRMSSGRPPCWSTRLRVRRADNPHRVSWLIEPIATETGEFPTIDPATQPPADCNFSPEPEYRREGGAPGLWESGLRRALGWTTLLRQGELSSIERKVAAAEVEQHLLRQAAIVEEIWDAARLEIGVLKLQLRRHSLARTVRLCVDALRPAAEAEGKKLSLRIDREVLVLGDELRLAQVATSLLSNAIKFTAPGGHIDVRLAVSNDAAALCVSDTGRGIPSEMLNRLFESPWRREDIRADTGAGIPWGLFVVGRIVELHNGTVRAFSAGPGRGSTFTVELPRYAA